MPLATLGSNPTVADTVDAYRKATAQVLDDAAGRDGRVSVTEAIRIRDRRDGGAAWSDDVLHVLDAAGQSTISRSKLERLLGTQFEAAASGAAGPDGRVSLADGRSMPARFRQDFAYLRGQLPADPAPLTAAELRALVQSAAFQAVDAGTAVKLAMPPKVVRGRKPVFEHVPHPASNTRLSGYVANGQIYVSRSSSVPSPLVGWWHVGKAP